jgi:hypothetical protein
MIKMAYTPRPIVILVSLVFTSFALIAQNTSTVDRMIRQRDSLENEIKLEQLRSSLKELNSISESFVVGKSNDIEKIMVALDRLCTERLRYRVSNLSKSGDQGPLNSSGTVNDSGGSGGGNYQLGTRTVIDRPKPRYDCDGEGIVVVKIYVDRNGVVKSADGQGEKGSITANECLIRRAEEAALKTRWQRDPSAVELQVGTIRYNFIRT